MEFVSDAAGYDPEVLPAEYKVTKHTIAYCLRGSFTCVRRVVSV